MLKPPAKTIRSGREVDVEAEATEEEIVEATVETEKEIEMVTNEKKTAGKDESDEQVETAFPFRVVAAGERLQFYTLKRVVRPAVKFWM